MSAYSFFLENIVLRAQDVVRGRDSLPRQRFLEETQWWPRERLLALQWQEARRLLEHAFRSVPYYQEKFRLAGIALEDIRQPADWRYLPVLTRREVNAHREELCAQGFAGKLSPHSTGGSSGVPTHFYITEESYVWRTAATQRVYAWSGCKLGTKALYLWGAPIGEVSRAHALKVRLHEAIQRQLIFNTFAQSDELWEGIHRAALRYRPKIVVGYVSSLEQFARFLTRTGRTVPGVKGAIACAEPLPQPTRNVIEQALHAPMFNTYGCREFKSIAGECEVHGGMHINVENILLETADPDSPEASELLVTDLHNYGMPFIRYSIGDLGTLDPNPCPCGRGLPLLRSVDGRVLDVLRRPDGKLIPGEFFPHLLKDIPEILEYQVEQKSLEWVVVSAVLSGPLAPSSQATFESEVRKVCGGLRVELQPVSEIPRLPSGKRRVTVGLVHAS
jgi:phenylacetate-CoA ligase